ncbi:MAG: mechanosensitive ion channel family protein [Rhodanobacter sp.]
MLDWLQQTSFAHNSLMAWAYAIGGAVLGFLLVAGVLQLVTTRLQKLHQRIPRPSLAALVAVLKATRHWLVLLLALVVAAEFLHSSERVTKLLAHLVFALCGLQLALWANALVSYWLHRHDNRVGGPLINPVFMNMFTWGLQLLVWSVLLLALLADVGVNITAFVASLGVGGIAVALALQNILGDLFASVAIGLDKPFEVGNYIAFGTTSGTVTQVGVKSTRIAALSGEQLVISNSNLLKELIHNYSRMAERRIVFGFRVPYSTRAEDVQAIVEQTRAAIEAEEKARFDRGHLIAFGEYGFDFEFVYYVCDPGFALYRDIQQRVNFKIMAQLEALQVSFAVPVREIQPREASFPALPPDAAR